MNLNERRELLRLIEEMGEGYPEFRLGQLIANLAFWACGDQESAVWNVEDEELLTAAREQIRNAKHREGKTEHCETQHS